MPRYILFYFSSSVIVRLDTTNNSLLYALLVKLLRTHFWGFHTQILKDSSNPFLSANTYITS